MSLTARIALSLLLTLSPFVNLIAQESTANRQTPAPMLTATASGNSVRYVSMGEVHQTRLQVFSTEGAQVFDSGPRLGNLIDWQLNDQQGSVLSDGSYLFLVTVKDFSARLTQKYGVAVLEQEQVYLERVNSNELSQPQATALESNRQSEALMPLDRIGAAGLNRAATTTASTNASSAGAKATATGASSAATTPTVDNIGGTGTQNRIAKWVDGAGNLGDSNITEVDNKVGIGTPTPDAALKIFASTGRTTTPALWVSDQNDYLGAAMYFDWRNGPVNNKIHAFIADIYGLSFYRMNDTGTNTIPSGFTTPDFVISPTGNIGIGTNSPQSRLSVNGTIESLGAINAASQYNIGGVRVLGNPGTQNIFAGALAGPANTGSSNSFFGFNAGNSNTGGGNNTLMGAFSNVSSGNLTNATALGYRATVGRSNSLVLGSVENAAAGTVAVNVGIGTSFPLYPLTVFGRGTVLPFAAAEFSNTNSDSGIIINSKSGSERAWALVSSSNGSSLGVGSFSIADLNANQTRFLINSSGNVGIGTSTLNSRLNVNGGVDATQYNINNNRVLSIGGLQNIFAGGEAGLNNTGSFNSFVGFGAGRVNTGNANAFFGTSAGLSNTSGANNVFFGVDAGRVNADGSGNSFFGRNAGLSNIEGSNNTLIGAFANVGSRGLTNATAIGANAQVNTSNTMVLGTSAVSVQVPGTFGVSGNLSAGNLPGVAFSQSRNPIEIEDNGSSDLNQVVINVPANGFLYISAFVNVRAVQASSCFAADLKLIRVHSPDNHEELAVTRNGSGQTLASGIRNSQSFTITWVLAVSPGVVTLKTNVASFSCSSIGAYDRSLSVVYLPKGY